MSAGETSPLDRLAGTTAPTVEATLRALRAAFVFSGEGARAEARTIVAHVLGLDLTGLVVGGERPVAEPALARIVALARRRLTGEPVQRLVGEADFFGLTFALTPATLVPRADTETLVEAVLARIEGWSAPILADLGVGSGAVLVALLHERGDAVGVATDLSGEALATARANAARHGVGDRALFVRGSYASMLAAGGFDAIASNPPYIATEEITTLDEEVRRHDPTMALDGGADGLEAYRAIAAQAIGALRPGGLLAVEIGHTQAASVSRLLVRTGFIGLETVSDLAGRDRVVVARAGTATK